MRWKRSLICIGAGILLFLIAEVVDSRSAHVEKGVLYRNSCGQGDAVYEFYAEDEDGRELKTSLAVPEQRMTKKEFHERVPEMTEMLCIEILGENSSLNEIRSNLNLITELPEYGVLVSWRSQMPEVISRSGVIDQSAIDPMGTGVVLEATLQCGDSLEIVEISVVVYPREITWEERFRDSLVQLAQQDMETETVILPAEFEDRPVTYRSLDHGKNLFLIVLGVIAAVLLHLNEKQDLQKKKKDREENLLFLYQDLVSNFLILTGAGYLPKMAWKKIAADMAEQSGEENDTRSEVLLKEMQITVNQMETGVSEARAYTDFGKRCGNRCYVRFASLLVSSVQTGGKNLRTMLETEMEEAFRQRAELARKRGEEASSKLLLPLFGMLGIVMVMVAAPAFLSFG